MAQKKKASTKTSPKKTSSKKTKQQSTQPPEPFVPIRREVFGVLFLFLSIFTGIGYFVHEGSFICFFSALIRGLAGWGYWLSAPVFMLISFILLFHRGRPVSLRVFCALLLPIVFAALWSIFGQNTYDYDNIKVLLPILFESGQMLESAGLLGGLLAVGLEMAFSVYGAVPVLLVLFVFSCIFAFSGSPKKTAERVKLQVETKYDPSMYEDALSPVNTVMNRIPIKREQSRIERINRSEYSADIPLGEDEEPLPLHDSGSAQTVPFSTEPKNRRKSKKKESEDTADDTLPLSAEDSARIAKIVSEEQAEERSVIAQKPAYTKKTVSVEISDPPKAKRSKRIEIERQTREIADEISANESSSDYEFPPMSLLKSGLSESADYSSEIITNRNRLVNAIKSFGINAAIVGVTRGPTVTRYDFELEQGVKLARITNLSGDLALALGVINVRIAPIPDKISTVGIEVPNKIISSVCLRDIIDTPKFAASKSKLSFALGKDISGEGIIGNIAKLPHLLIAGTTGSGKSVCMNSLILSILYKAKPDEVKLIMIDPKMVELGVYNGIPHMYVPVVTDPKKAAGALQWSVVEMLKRYRLFADASVRDLESYNRHCVEIGENTLPQVVIVIDELADLMMAASKEVEESICRVAQMGRAAGMHLVIATQRPSADVITGLMKANIPSRIAFAVSSAMESRIILDQTGAEKLIGMGDMLFAPVGCGKPKRIQGAFVSDEEREEIVQFIKESAGSSSKNSEIEEYMNKAVEDKSGSDGGSKSGESDAAGAYDEMLSQAVEVVLETKSCSVSMLQRRIKLGYARAARIVDQMEELGIVGPYEGAKPRQVIVDREGWNNIRRRLGLIQDDEMALAAEINGSDD